MFISIIASPIIRKNALKAAEEKPLKVYYDNETVGDFYIDLLVKDEIVIELKSVENLNKAHEVQLVNYLNGLKKEIGLLINFGPTGVEVKRKYRKPVVRQDKPRQARGRHGITLC